MTAFLTGVVAFIKAIPAIQKIFNQVVHIYLNTMDEQTVKYFSELKEKRNYAIKKLKASQSDDDIVDNFNDIMR